MKFQFLFVALALALAAVPTHAFLSFDSSRHVWFTFPGFFPTFESSLPLGNGRVAASIYGGRIRCARTASLRRPRGGPVVREMLLAGNLSEGREYAYEQMISNVTSPRAFSYFGNIEVDFGHTGGAEMTDYLRWLDTREGTAGGAYIASYPSGVLAARFNASAGGELNMNISMTGLIEILSVTASAAQDNNTLTLRGIERTIAREAEMRRKIDAVFALGYDVVKSTAIADTTALSGRVTLDLGTSPNGWAALQTDQRLAIARNTSEDVQLSTLVFNFGRYLLAASSRPSNDGTVALPANLQGIWKIRLLRRLGATGPTNMLETELPLFDLISVAIPRGQSAAEKIYGCLGTVFHHNLELWGDPAPTDNFTASTMWPFGAAWFAWHAIDHYRFTQDENFLRDVAYPFLSEVTSFYECYAFENDGRIIPPDSVKFRPTLGL
ncbi:Six-hairpin glycosidase-like protein [Mycena olivaceomarginata]|nr:Six-hairpin glycosidase-like protein [Mycena olivaceomarginata]